ncbi:hypothetical protein niasHT_033763 [Heterodera trifolii]|uniref:Uncharacterized protein n=1 Tax=Heterodera trifolii TaxID=157864 RepID=A0ABD2IWM2_9BILA
MVDMFKTQIWCPIFRLLVQKAQHFEQNKSHHHHRHGHEECINEPLKTNAGSDKKGIVIDESLKYMSKADHHHDQMESTLLRSLTFAIAMSFHSVLEGFALGVQDNNTGILTLFVSLIIHKGIEAFSVGLQISRSNGRRMLMVILTIIVYSLMTPFGSLVGVLVTNMDIDELLKDAISVVLEALAGGTFIYVTFFEVLAQERANHHSNLVQLSAIVLGFLVICALQVNEQFTEQTSKKSIQGH